MEIGECGVDGLVYSDTLMQFRLHPSSLSHNSCLKNPFGFFNGNFSAPILVRVNSFQKLLLWIARARHVRVSMDI